MLLIIIGVIGGVIGGMGMGGGTLLIPLLTIFVGVEQHSAQALNLLAFIPMSVVAIAIHIKNKLIDFKQVLPIAIPAVAAGVGSSVLSKLTGARALSRWFGLFLVSLGIYQLISAIVALVKNIREKRRELLKMPDEVDSRHISATLF
ncbi:MAG: sulfite exporter TauE/SafE family protein [Clostridia bacterium]|nr:sulfite exporter TauE/SafE family protein [Clostridia bacterium]